jgi:two-component system cell cycle sensor histidine kinase/response regulator CckA
VDDEELVRNILLHALHAESCEILTAASGPEALELCEGRAQPIHLAILDIVMPGMNGPELLACLRDLYPKIRVLFMSGYPKSEAFEIAHLSKEEGYFLAKPFNLVQIRDRVRQELAALHLSSSSSG